MEKGMLSYKQNWTLYSVSEDERVVAHDFTSDSVMVGDSTFTATGGDGDSTFMMTGGDGDSAFTAAGGEGKAPLSSVSSDVKSMTDINDDGWEADIRPP